MGVYVDETGMAILPFDLANLLASLITSALRAPAFTKIPPWSSLNNT